MVKRTPDEPGAGELRIVSAEPAEPEVPDTLLSYEEAMTKRTRERVLEATALRLAGLPLEQIAKRLGITTAATSSLLERRIAQAPKVADMRELENMRLDRAQAAIWSDVIGGDLKAIETFLKISARRSKLNGMDEATKIDLSIGVRQEMQVALDELQQVVLGEVVRGELADGS